MKTKKNITQVELHQQLDYDRDTGIFKWKVSRSGVTMGKIAGCLTSHGYISMRLNGRRYYAHRLAWLYEKGYFPENQIDHINRNKTDNSIINLREVNQSCNTKNGQVRSDNKSGVTGISWDKRDSKWIARIFHKNKYKMLGRFKNLKDAVEARHEAEIKCEYPRCQTISSAKLYLDRLIEN